MRSSLKSLIKVNTVIFLNCFFVGCTGFNIGAFENQYLEPTKLANLEDEVEKNVKTLTNKYFGGKKGERTEETYFLEQSMLRGKKRVSVDFISQYITISKKYFKTQNLSISDNFKEEIKEFGKKLVEEKSDNILFKLFCFSIDAIHIAEKDQFLSSDQKNETIKNIISSYHSTIDELILQSFDLENDNEFFSYEKILSELNKNKKECYVYTNNVTKIEFPFIIGATSKVIEYMFIKKTDPETYKEIESTKKFFDLLDDFKIKYEDDLDGINKLIDQLDKFLVSYTKDLNVELRKKFQNIYSIKDLSEYIKISNLPWSTVIIDLKYLKKNSNFLINISDVFLLKGTNVIFSPNQKFFIVKEGRADGKTYITADYDKEQLEYDRTEIKEAEMISDYERFYQSIGKSGDKNDFIEANSKLQELTELSQEVIIEYILEYCNKILADNPYRGRTLKWQSYSWENKTVARKNDLYDLIAEQQQNLDDDF